MGGKKKKRKKRRGRKRVRTRRNKIEIYTFRSFSFLVCAMHRHNNRLRSTHRERPCFWHEFNYFYRDQTEFKWSLQVSRSRSKAGARGEAYFIFPLDQFLSLSLSLGPCSALEMLGPRGCSRKLVIIRYVNFNAGGSRNFRFTSFHKEEADVAAMYAALL